MAKTARGQRYVWTAEENSIIERLYPEGGPDEVWKLMQHRSKNAITQQACRLKVANAASPYSRPLGDEVDVPVPAHDYTPEDRAWMNTRMPVFGGGFGAARIAA